MPSRAPANVFQRLVAGCVYCCHKSFVIKGITNFFLSIFVYIEAIFSDKNGKKQNNPLFLNISAKCCFWLILECFLLWKDSYLLKIYTWKYQYSLVGYYASTLIITSTLLMRSQIWILSGEMILQENDHSPPTSP